MSSAEGWGRRRSGSGRHDVYDSATDTVDDSRAVADAAQRGRLVRAERRIVRRWRVQGPGDGHDVQRAEVYDPAANKWTALPPLPVGRHAGAAIALGDQAYVIGGNNGWRRSRGEEILTFRLPAS